MCIPLASVAAEIDLNTADMENAHAFNKTIAACGIETVASASVLRQSTTLTSALRAAATKPMLPQLMHVALANPRLRSYHRWNITQFYHWQRAQEHLRLHKDNCLETMVWLHL